MTITVDEETRALVDAINARTGAPRSETIRRAVAFYAENVTPDLWGDVMSREIRSSKKKRVARKQK